MSSSWLLVVTGASRGLGRAVATCVARNQGLALQRVRALLVARSEEGLEETRVAMTNTAPLDVSLDVSKHAMDLSKLESLDQSMDVLLEQVRLALDQHPYDRVVWINNAGSLGHLGPVTEIESLESLKHYLDFNVTSCLWISTRFLKFISNQTTTCTSSIESTVVNISSLCALQPFTNMASYCAGKAARDMFHQVAAKEHGDSNNKIKILNYAPGALDTDMTTTLRSTKGFESGVAGDLIPPEQTARRLVRLILENEFQSGSHIDYWDLTDE